MPLSTFNPLQNSANAFLNGAVNGGGAVKGNNILDGETA
jgi:hypothetical protein